MLDALGWLFQAIVAHWVILTLGFAGAAVLAALKKYWPSVAGPVLYGAAGFALVVMSLSTLKELGVVNTLMQEPPIQSDENLEETIRGWADSFGWGTRPLQIENALIAFEVTLFNNAVRISVIQRERLKGFLSIGINIVLSDDQREQFYDLEQDVADLLVRTLRIEMSRMGMNFSNIDVPLTRVSLEKKLPITGSLAQHEFLSTVSQVNRARILYSETIGLTLNQGNITQ